MSDSTEAAKKVPTDLADAVDQKQQEGVSTDKAEAKKANTDLPEVSPKNRRRVPIQSLDPVGDQPLEIPAESSFQNQTKPDASESSGHSEPDSSNTPAKNSTGSNKSAKSDKSDKSDKSGKSDGPADSPANADSPPDAEGDIQPRSDRQRPIRRRRAPKAAVTVDPQEDDTSSVPLLSDLPSVLPVMALRDNVVFNSMIVPIFEAREHPIMAVDAALASNRFLFICTQKDASIEEPEPQDLYHVGSVVMILRMVRMPDGQVKILVQGLSRGIVENFVPGEPYLRAKVNLLSEIKTKGSDDGKLGVQEEAMVRAAREQSEKILNLRGIATGDIMSVLMGVDDPGRLADLIAANMRLRVPDAQVLLECLDPIQRLKLVNEHLAREVEVAGMQSRIQRIAREGMDKAQKDYYLREQLKAIRKELGDAAASEEDLDTLAEALDKAGLPAEAKKEADKQLRRLATMHNDSAEATVARTYLEWLAELPWKKTSRDRLDINKAKEILDDDHYGLLKIKDRILEYLSVRKLNPDSHGPILCFVGPPGVGKTSLGRSIAKAMGRKFQRISLGGMRDEAEIRGHRRTYIGAMPGRILQVMKQAGTRNPLIVLDEIDKLGNDFRGDPASALLEVLDPEQNSHFSDHYLNLEFDLSKVLFLCTANHLESIPHALMDRLEVITLAGYTEQEKLAIAKKYLLPRQIKNNGLKSPDIEMRDPAITKLIHEYTREAGLRNLERELGSVCRKLARKKAEGTAGPFQVTTQQVAKLLGAPRFLDEERDTVLRPGVALGLAWTQAGGEVLHIEATTMKGKGQLILTGQLGDVMKESAQAALSYARSHAESLGIDPDFSEKLDIHIHVPAGATPKDGPSAGVSLMAALVSILSHTPTRGDTCMTGEITLRGRVLPVGGIKEKILAGVARGLKHAVIPKQNTKDLEDIPHDLLRKIAIHPVASIDELLPLVLVKVEDSKKEK